VARVLVTGGTGFLGSSLVQRLLSEGHFVRVLTRSHTRSASLVRQGADPIVGEITESDVVRSALQDVEIVYHLAGQLFSPEVRASVYHRTHVLGTEVLVACCREQPTIKKFVHGSTTGVFGATGDSPAAEDAPHAPSNAYERTKSEAELLVREANRHGFPAVIVRPGLVYGPGDLHLLGFFRAIQRGLFRPIGRRQVQLHPIYVDDLTEMLVRCAHDPRAVGKCFNVAGSQPVTISVLAATIAHALGVTAPRGTIPLPVARLVALAGDLLPPPAKHLAPLTSSRLDFLTHSRVYATDKARQTLDFSAATGLVEGIERTVAWYRDLGYLPPARGAVSTPPAMSIAGHR
jgi:nucleoside-diphosphate-sugar epimerase